MFGATEQNVLKLFEWVIECPNSNALISLMVSKAPQVKIIY